MTDKAPTPQAIRLRREQLKDRLKNLLVEMQQVTIQATGLTAEWDQASVQRLFRVTAALHSFLLASGSSIGECRREKPYAPLKPVIDDQGNFKWCCEHNPEHCT